MFKIFNPEKFHKPLSHVKIEDPDRILPPDSAIMIRQRINRIGGVWGGGTLTVRVTSHKSFDPTCEAYYQALAPNEHLIQVDANAPRNELPAIIAHEVGHARQIFAQPTSQKVPKRIRNGGPKDIVLEPKLLGVLPTEGEMINIVASNIRTYEDSSIQTIERIVQGLGIGPVSLPKGILTNFALRKIGKHIESITNNGPFERGAIKFQQKTPNLLAPLESQEIE